MTPAEKTEYRSRPRVISDILGVASGADLDQGVGITMLLHDGNLSYSRATTLLSELLGAGLLERMSTSGAPRYRISPRGVEFLSRYNTFAEFAQAFGLRL